MAKRLLTLALALLMLLTLATACSGDSGGTGGTGGSGANLLEGPFPLVEEKVTLKFFAPADPANGAWDQLEMLIELEELTNVHIECEQVLSEAYEERFNLLVATGPLPDVFFNCTSAANEGKLGGDGIIIPLEDLIAEHAPHIAKRFEEHPDHKKTCTALDGHIYGTGILCKTVTMGSYKTFINLDWLKAADMEMPKTLADYEAYMEYVKNNDMNGDGDDSDEIPFDEWLNPTGVSLIDGVALAWFGEVISPAYPLLNLKGDEVSFVFNTEGFKEYTRWMKSLIEKGYAADTLVTQTIDEVIANANAGTVGSGTYLTRAADPDKFTDVMPPLTTPMNSKQLAPPVDLYTAGAFAVTKDCANPDVAVKWLDLFYRTLDEEVDTYSGLTMWIGRRGVDWDFTDDSETAYKWLFEPQDEMTTWMYYIKHKGIGWGPGMIWLEVPSDDPYLAWVANQNTNGYFPFWDSAAAIPAGVRLTDDESRELNTLATEITTTVLEFRAKYLQGQVGEDDWATYEAQLDSIGLARYIEVMQAAYDRFNG